MLSSRSQSERYKEQRATMTTAIALKDVKSPFKAVAEYPPTLPYIGQDSAYFRLQGFAEVMRSEEEAHFLALFGDWAIGKSRLAHELIAQFSGQNCGWMLSDGTQTAPLLLPLTAGGDVVPLFVSFVDAYNFQQQGLDTGTAMGKLICAAAAYLADANRARSSHYQLLVALRGALTSVNPNCDFESLKTIATDTKFGYAERAGQIVAALGAMTGGRAKRVLVIVDEVESGGDTNPFPDAIQREVNSNPIPVRAVRDLYTAVKDATNTNAYPTINFLFFNTLTSRRLAYMDALDRRMMTANMEKASAADLDRLVDAIRQTGYPLEGMLQDLAQRAFFAADRNFGWFSFIMNRAHVTLVQQPDLGIGQIFAEVYKRTGKVFQPDVFEDRDIYPPALKDAMRHVIYNQTPTPLAELKLDSSLRNDLFTYQDQFQTRFIGAAAHVEVSADQLTNALLQTGLYIGDSPPRLTGEGSVRFIPAEILSSLRTFAWAGQDGEPRTSLRLWIYADPADFEIQVSFAYAKFGQDLSAETVRTCHRVLMERFQVGESAQLVAPTMALLRRFNDLWGKAAANNWLPDAEWESLIKEVEGKPERFDARLLSGIANVLFDTPQALTTSAPYPDVKALSLTLKLEQAMLFNVTSRNQLVLLQARETPQNIMDDLRAIKQRVPVFLIFARASDRDAWERHVHEEHEEHRAVAVITHVVEPQTREWEFYVRYSLRDTPEGFKFDAPNRKGKDLRDEFREVLHEQFKQWLVGVEQRGYVLRPFSPTRSASTPQFRDFARFWGELLRAGSVAALGARAAAVIKGIEDYERERQSDTLQLIAGEGAARQAVIPAVLPHLLDFLLRMQPRKIPELADEVFFVRSPRTVSFPTTGSQVMEQLLALAKEIGVVETDAEDRYTVRTVTSFNRQFDQAFQRLGTLEGAPSGYAAQVGSLSSPVQALAGQLDVNEHQLTLLRTHKLQPEQDRLKQLPLDRLTVLPPDQAAFEQVARGVGDVATALGEVLGRAGNASAPPAIDPYTLQSNIESIAADRGYQQYAIEYRVAFLQLLEEYLTRTERDLRERLTQTRTRVAGGGAADGGLAFPTRPLLALLDGVQADLDATLPNNTLPQQLRKQSQDAALTVLRGAGQLSEVLLKLAWYTAQLDEKTATGWWTRYATAREQWRATYARHEEVAQAWQSLEQYFAGTVPEHRTLFTGAALSGDVQELAEQVAAFSEQFNAPNVALDELASEIDGIRGRCTAVSELIQTAQANADAEIENQLAESQDAAVRKLAKRLGKESILPDRQRVLSARTHQAAHIELGRYQQNIAEVGASMCDGRPELYDRYLKVVADVNAGMTGDQIIERYTDAVVREMSGRKLLTLKYSVEL